ncbi:PfkB family carbohydrate kinase [Polymorphum gilvum]|uniref:Kinase, pfkB family n=1 Tax=Polymorphum gilvum (strain LMG 25793 / CGMCC 1.9160 / SL003B-26A1) TaxID=991905 RepID=F2J461_POLGS|nr:PfkB family carbohydrate kinase [Polymorphum gilvum]ADZ69987.1 Kinase, pfkB family [Polymorphum gilvum SL003B-26A1]
MPYPPQPAAACFGAIHVDVIAHATRPARRETSTPGVTETAPGGVATNVARTLVRLGISCALAGALGRDADGDRLAAELAREGISLGAVQRRDLPTGRYLAVHDPDGSLAAAVVDARITDTLDADALALDHPEIAAAGLWFAEANLPGAVLERIALAAGDRHLAADAVSIAKAPRLEAVLARLDLLVLNRAEAAALTGLPEAVPLSDHGERLAQRGVRALAISDGAAPLHWRDGTTQGSIAPRPCTIVDVTGAGDALIAGTLAALVRDRPLAQALETGLRAAECALGGSGAVPSGMTWPVVAGMDRD